MTRPSRSTAAVAQWVSLMPRTIMPSPLYPAAAGDQARTMLYRTTSPRPSPRASGSVISSPSFSAPLPRRLSTTARPAAAARPDPSANR